MAQWLALVAEYDKAGCAGGGSVSGGGLRERTGSGGGGWEVVFYVFLNYI